MVVFVDKEIYLQIHAGAGLIEVLQLFHGSAHGVQSLQSALGKEVFIRLAEVLESSAAVRVQPFTVVVQLAGDAGEVEVEHEVAVAARRGVLSDVEVAEEVVELAACTYVVVVLQGVQCQTLAETPGTDEEKETVCLLYQGDETCLVHIIIVFVANVREVHHPVGEAFSVRYDVFHCFHRLSSFCFVALYNAAKIRKVPIGCCMPAAIYDGRKPLATVG